MAQAGIHAMVGIVARKWMPKREWLLLGVVLGNMFPDLDNLVVAYAVLAKLPDPEQYHRTFTHSVFTVAVVMILFYLVAALTKNEKWKNFGIGFGGGILMHMLLDLVIWFNGVPLFWPLHTPPLHDCKPQSAALHRHRPLHRLRLVCGGLRAACAVAAGAR